MILVKSRKARTPGNLHTDAADSDATDSDATDDKD